MNQSSLSEAALTTTHEANLRGNFVFLIYFKRDFRDCVFDTFMGLWLGSVE